MQKRNAIASTPTSYFFAKRAMKRWGKHKNIQILGSHKAARLPVFSFLIRNKGKVLHYNFVVALLNDVFGIQARGGCSCAGPYGHRLLDIDLKTSHEYEAVIATGVEILKPGWVRVGFNYFFSDEDAELLLRAVEWVADHGAEMLPYYGFESATGVWKHMDAGDTRLSDLTAPKNMPAQKDAPAGVEDLIRLANNYIGNAPERCVKPDCCVLDTTPQHLRWFSLPQ